MNAELEAIMVKAKERKAAGAYPDWVTELCIGTSNRDIEILAIAAYLKGYSAKEGEAEAIVGASKELGRIETIVENQYTYRTAIRLLTRLENVTGTPFGIRNDTAEIKSNLSKLLLPISVIEKLAG